MSGRPSKRARVSGGKDGKDGLQYLWGYGGVKSSEALPNAIPKGQNNPQRCPYDLYCEKLSGSAFTAPRACNMQTWLYRIRPSVQHSPFTESKVNPNIVGDFNDPAKAKVDPSPLRWMPPELPSSPQTFVQGLTTVGGSGSASMGDGIAVHLYTASAPMTRQCLCNSDGDFLIVPQVGVLTVRTEMGVLRVEPCEVVVVQRGIRFAVDVDEPSRGYVLEVFGRHFTLPELGPIGSYGLANGQDFAAPTAAFDDKEEPHVVYNKMCGEMFESQQEFSPLNVVGWMGSFFPFKYDLRRFMCMNSVNYDHPDPSIYTVLTCQSDEPGVAVADFVIFPPRWMVMEHSFRPPWYHRNTMSEFMGMIWGQYDAKLDTDGKGFVEGGYTLHNSMTPHGPDAAAFDKATTGALSPDFFDKGLAFMFESKFTLKLTPAALASPARDLEYYKCWASLARSFSDWLPSGKDNLLAWREEAKEAQDGKGAKGAKGGKEKEKEAKKGGKKGGKK